MMIIGQTLMTDGIDSYKGFEINWAVSTIIENAESCGMSNFANTTEMVEAAYEFIVVNFEEECLAIPSKRHLVELVDLKLSSDG